MEGPTEGTAEARKATAGCLALLGPACLFAGHQLPGRRSKISSTRASPYGLNNSARVHRCTDKGYTAFAEHLTTRSARSCQVRRAWEPFFLLATRVIP